jgi:hypothetical protein
MYPHETSSTRFSTRAEVVTRRSRLRGASVTSITRTLTIAPISCRPWLTGSQSIRRKREWSAVALSFRHSHSIYLFTLCNLLSFTLLQYVCLTLCAPSPLLFFLLIFHTSRTVISPVTSNHFSTRATIHTRTKISRITSCNRYTASGVSSLRGVGLGNLCFALTSALQAAVAANPKIDYRKFKLWEGGGAGVSSDIFEVVFIHSGSVVSSLFILGQSFLFILGQSF